jgi:hypothetical protein
VCPPESKFIAALHAFVGAPQILPALVSLRLRSAQILAETGLFARRLLDLSARESGKRRWVDKTPNYYRILPFIDQLFQIHVLFLFIVRHPLDNIASLHERFWYATSEREDPEIAGAVECYGNGLQARAHYWREVQETIDVFAAGCPDRCFVFKYEDLICASTTTMDDLFRFLDETPDERLPQIAFQKHHDEGYEDPRSRVSDALHARSIGRWRQWPPGLAQRIWPIVADRAGQFDYSIDEPDAG